MRSPSVMEMCIRDSRYCAHWQTSGDRVRSEARRAARRSKALPRGASFFFSLAWNAWYQMARPPREEFARTRRPHQHLRDRERLLGEDLVIEADKLGALHRHIGLDVYKRQSASPGEMPRLSAAALGMPALRQRASPAPRCLGRSQSKLWRRISHQQFPSSTSSR